MHSSRRALSVLTGLVTVLLVAVVACATSPGPAPIEDIRQIETQVAIKLAATLTAKAPPTPTPTPTYPNPTSPPAPTSTPTSTPNASFAAVGDDLAYVLVAADGSTNVVLTDEGQTTEHVLTHFVEPHNVCDVSWSADGSMLAVVSAHNFVHSRDNERNVFLMRADGSGLRMITGEYLSPTVAEGPYVSVRGTVAGCDGPALVAAQGAAAPVHSDDSGEFELLGVPVTAQWARAVCPSNGQILQGDTDLSLAEGENEPLRIEVRPQGAGWIRAALSPDGTLIAGIRYAWTLDEDGEQQLSHTGILHRIETGEQTELSTPEGTSLTSLAWSHAGDRLVGAVSSEEGASLLVWDATGNNLGEILKIPNAGEVAHSVVDLAWSPDDARIAFSRRDWDWWADTKYRSSIVVISATGGDMRVVVESDWGLAAEHPTWTNNGSTIYYQVSEAEPQDACVPTQGDIWRIRADLEDSKPSPWRADGRSLLPAIRPQPDGSP